MINLESHLYCNTSVVLSVIPAFLRLNMFVHYVCHIFIIFLVKTTDLTSIYIVIDIYLLICHIQLH